MLAYCFEKQVSRQEPTDLHCITAIDPDGPPKGDILREKNRCTEVPGLEFAVLESPTPSSSTKPFGGICSVMDGHPTNESTCLFSPPPPPRNRVACGSQFLAAARCLFRNVSQPIHGNFASPESLRNKTGNPKAATKSMVGFMFACVFLIPMLVACGGGGGGGSVGISGNPSSPGTPDMPHPADMSGSQGTPGPSGTSSLSHIAWLVDPSTARRAVNGAVTLSLTSDQGLKEINAIAAKSNEIDASRLWYKEQGKSAVHSAYDCEGGSCHGLRENGAPDFGLHDKNGLNLYETAIELQPVMSHHGVSIGQVRATTRSSEVQLYGGWMENSAFFVRWISYPDFNAAFPHAFGYTHYLRDNIGNPYRDNPQDLSSSGLGGTWTGAVVGIRYGGASVEGNMVHGNSEVSITDFTNATMDVSLTGLYDLDAGTGLADMTWTGLTVTEGAFSAGATNSDNQIRGRFYGSNHEEVSGTFDRNSIIGAFGAIRDGAGQ